MTNKPIRTAAEALEAAAKTAEDFDFEATVCLLTGDVEFKKGLNCLAADIRALASRIAPPADDAALVKAMCEAAWDNWRAQDDLETIVRAALYAARGALAGAFQHNEG